MKQQKSFKESEGTPGFTNNASKNFYASPSSVIDLKKQGSAMKSSSMSATLAEASSFYLYQSPHLE